METAETNLHHDFYVPEASAPAVDSFENMSMISTSEVTE